MAHCPGIKKKRKQPKTTKTKHNMKLRQKLLEAGLSVDTVNDVIENKSTILRIAKMIEQS